MTALPLSAPTAVAVEKVPAHAWKTMAVSAAGVFVVFLDTTVVNIAFPALSADFPTVSRAGLSWVLNAYAVVFGALLVTTGRLADARGRKKAFLYGLGVFAVASALCGLAPSVPALVGARALQAVGAALLVPASLALLLPEFPLSRRASAVGLWGAAGAVAAASGPVLGALLVQGPGWRWVFLVNLPFCAVAVLVGRRVLRESTGAAPEDARPDVPGVVLVTAVFGLLSLGLVQGQEWGWSSARVVGAFAVAAVAVPVLVLRALRHPSPVLPVLLFRVRTFSLATAGTLLFATAFFSTILCNVLFLTGVWQYSVLRTAVAVLPSPLLAAATAPFAGRLADRYGFRVVVVPGALSMLGGLVFLGTRTTAEPAYLTDFLPGSILVGLAIGFAFSALGAAAAQALPPAAYGGGSAVNATARQLGAVLGVAVLVAVLGEPGPGEALGAFHGAVGRLGRRGARLRRGRAGAAPPSALTRSPRRTPAGPGRGPRGCRRPGPRAGRAPPGGPGPARAAGRAAAARRGRRRPARAAGPSTSRTSAPGRGRRRPPAAPRPRPRRRHAAGRPWPGRGRAGRRRAPPPAPPARARGPRPGQRPAPRRAGPPAPTPPAAPLGRSGPTTTTRPASATADSTRSSRLRPPTSRPGLSTPPSRRADPPASTTAS